ncbi:hypothetical protein [Candidatus Nitrospira salsa]
MKINWELSVWMTGLVVSSAFCLGVSAVALADDSSETIKEQFGPVLKLEGKARKEINAIANILGPDSKMKSIDATDASGEMCMLETVSKHNMIHFSETPEKTHEDVVYFINPATFIANGLDVTKLPRHPKELGQMKPLQWYYYDGTYVEPHQGGQLNKEFVIMSVDVK